MNATHRGEWRADRCRRQDLLDAFDHGRKGDRTYVDRMLRLTSLAPDIIQAILNGDEPDGLSLEKLRKNLPVKWNE